MLFVLCSISLVDPIKAEPHLCMKQNEGLTITSLELGVVFQIL
jgi:hypothetical protein